MAVDTFDIQASATQTGNANSGTIEIPEGSMLEVDVLVTAQTAISAFSIWLETCTEDTPTNFTEMPFDLGQKTTRHTTAAAAEIAARTNAANIVNNETTSAVVARYKAVYKHIPAPVIRVRWFFTGTNITFSVRGSIK